MMSSKGVGESVGVLFVYIHSWYLRHTTAKTKERVKGRGHGITRISITPVTSVEGDKKSMRAAQLDLIGLHSWNVKMSFYP